MVRRNGRRRFDGFGGPAPHDTTDECDIIIVAICVKAGNRRGNNSRINSNHHGSTYTSQPILSVGGDGY